MVPGYVGLMKQEKWKKGESLKKSAEITSSDTLEEK